MVNCPVLPLVRERNNRDDVHKIGRSFPNGWEIPLGSMLFWDALGLRIPRVKALTNHA